MYKCIHSCGLLQTSLLHLLISELMLLGGTMKSVGRISYASQESWIFTGNIRQNILFGEAFDSMRYQEVVQAAALEDDFVQLPHGDMTIVGERGITLSGGQKARVNLARALYRNADIYILDDPLSAVDSRVSRHLFEKCVRSHLRGRLRILVTHQLQYLPQADHIIVLRDVRKLYSIFLLR
jgi:ATP-binding cassette subfamily C (CFTR/MRP) protein 4